MQKFITKTPEETKKIGFDLVKKMKGKGVICLRGSLGAGKTTFTKGCARALGFNERQIKSPTFIYIREHGKKDGKGKLYHCDFYRLQQKDNGEQKDNGKQKDHFAGKTFEEMEFGESLCIIEWPNNIQHILPKKRIEVAIEIIDENKRKIEIRSVK